MEWTATKVCDTFVSFFESNGHDNWRSSPVKDTYHHMFFDMLGNWLFGDYFKKVNGWAWELLNEVYKLLTDRIYATYFGGDDKAGLAPDNEAKDLWLTFLPSGCVLPFGCKVVCLENIANVWTTVGEETRQYARDTETV